MKIYAKQVDPEKQESPLFIDGCFLENIILVGNRNFKTHTTKLYDKIQSDFVSMANERSAYNHVDELLVDWGFVRQDGQPWTDIQIVKWDELLGEVLNKWTIVKKRTITQVLSLLTGKKWGITTIYGYDPSDWQDIIYPVDELSREDLREFEGMYFNMGTEWIVDTDTQEMVKEPDDIDGFSMYVTENGDDNIKAKIAEQFDGATVKDVILYRFNGYIKIVKYEMV